MMTFSPRGERCKTHIKGLYDKKTFAKLGAGDKGGCTGANANE